MARPQKCRIISNYPDYWNFSAEETADFVPVIMTLDEFETIRLIDRESLTQEECASRMGVARTTVTAIYDSARKKLAAALVDGRPLRLQGGHYSLSERSLEIHHKEESHMRVAVTYENGNVFQHFGHTEQFKLYDVRDGEVTSSQIVDTNGSGHGALAGFLQAAQVDALICGGIGLGAQNALEEAGIQLFAGISGSADAAVKDFLEGELQYKEGATCDHHHGEDHSCGHHEDHHGCGHHCG